ncbi:hypothetical protein DIY09_10880 [Streptococcus iniae]|uniref:hypothetical protein n=1 Tax=Streptococcus iniae TaxID=1346 RepID=UPI000EF6FC6C|nr:hypothetical protein [Streptococcus iniae]RLU51053.1 hypothetical protein DIY09_10880 [Streptococcus iniae]
MEFKITKKYLLDIASIRLDSKVREINRERKDVSNREYYWEYGVNKKQKPKYSMLSNEEIYSNNPPLIGQIRRGKINKKNPHLFTNSAVKAIYNNCKISPFETNIGLNEEEQNNFRKRNMMFKSYDEIFFGSESEQHILETFFPTALMLDILYEKYDENLWRIVLGYVPLNIVFEKIKLNVKDTEKVYNLLIKDNWELLMTGIFRASEKFGIIGGSVKDIFTLDIEYFVDFYNSSFRIEQEGQNRLARIERALTLFYEEVLKEKFEQFIHSEEGFEYHSIESMIAIQKDAQEYQKSIIKLETTKLLGITSSSWDNEFLDELECINKKEELGDEYSDLLHVTRISKMIDKVFEEMTVLQSKHEDSNHWGGNYLGYIKKYQKGNEILAYFSTGNTDLLKPLILESERQEDMNSDHIRRKLYIKKHPNSNLAKEESEMLEGIEKWKMYK